jgi:hypothetical protein
MSENVCVMNCCTKRKRLPVSVPNHDNRGKRLCWIRAHLRWPRVRSSVPEPLAGSVVFIFSACFKYNTSLRCFSAASLRSLVCRCASLRTKPLFFRLMSLVFADDSSLVEVALFLSLDCPATQSTTIIRRNQPHHHGFDSVISFQPSRTSPAHVHARLTGLRLIGYFVLGKVI